MMSVPVNDFAKANELLAKLETEQYYSCCGKSICGGCVHSFVESGNIGKCPFCNSDLDKTDEEAVEELMKRVEVNDAGSMLVLGSHYYHGGLQQDHAKALELWKRAADLGYGKAHYELGVHFHEGGNMKKAKFHFEAGAMAGLEVARFNLGCMEHDAGRTEQAVKHWIIAASAGHYAAINDLQKEFKSGNVSRELIDSTLTAYNTSCAEMRSEARDALIRLIMGNN
jgi:TPR repeat protein